MSKYTDQEVAGWNSHRERHRRPYVPASRPTPPAPKRKRPERPHDAAIRGFSTAMQEAEKHRAVLKNRFGYNDKQIGTLALAFRKRHRPYRALADAFLRAKSRMG